MTDKNVATKFQTISSPIPILIGETKQWKGSLFKMTSKSKTRGEFKIYFEWRQTKNGTIASSMHIESMNDHAINADIIREIKVGHLLREDMNIQQTNLKQSDGMIEFINQNRSEGFDQSIRLTPSIQRVKKIPGKRTITQQLELIAEVWAEVKMLPTHESPGKYIAKRLDINYNTARTRIKQCRDCGLIPRSSHGNSKLKPKRLKGKTPS